MSFLSGPSFDSVVKTEGDMLEALHVLFNWPGITPLCANGTGLR